MPRGRDVTGMPPASGGGAAPRNAGLIDVSGLSSVAQQQGSAPVEQSNEPAARGMRGSQHMSRAEFLRGLALAGAGIALGPGLAACGGSTTTGTASTGSAPRRGGKLTIAYIGGG